MRRIGILLLLLWAPLVALAAVQVEQVRYSAAADTSRVVFHLSDVPQYKVFTLSAPERVVIDLKDARLATSLKGIDFSGSPLTAIRSGPRPGGGLRLVLDLGAKVRHKSFLLQPSEGQGLRLVVDLEADGRMPRVADAAPAAAVSVAAAPVAAPPAAAPVKAAVAPPPVSAPAPAPAPVPQVAAPAGDGELRDLVIAIDAGHGGVDPGAIGPAGTKEKEVVLAIARKLEALVRAEPGMRPVMIRDGDHFVRLRDRVNRARESRADILISIHADAVHERSARGSSVYVLSSRGASSEAARWLAEQENASDLIGGVSLDDKDNMLKSVLLDLSQTATIEASLTAGDHVLTHLKGLGRVHRQRVEQAGFVVLKAPDIPSMLVETAFISNPDEERKLVSPQHQRQVARAILDGVKAYFRHNAPPGTKVALWNSTRRHVIARGDTLDAIANRYGVSIHHLRGANKLADDRLLVGDVLRIPSGDGT